MSTGKVLLGQVGRCPVRKGLARLSHSYSSGTVNLSYGLASFWFGWAGHGPVRFGAERQGYHINGEEKMTEENNEEEVEEDDDVDEDENDVEYDDDEDDDDDDDDDGNEDYQETDGFEIKALGIKRRYLEVEILDKINEKLKD